MGGIGADDGTDTGSEGDDDTPGDKGQLNGNPYASSYFGSPGSGNGGVGYGSEWPWASVQIESHSRL